MKVPRHFGLLILLLVTTAVGCSGPSSTKLLGTWRLEGADKLAEVMTGVPKPSGALGALLGSAMSAMKDQMDASLEVTFEPEGRLSTQARFAGTTTEKSGTWKLIRTDGTTYVLWCQMGEDDPIETTVQLVDDSTLTMIPPNIAVLKRSFTFRKVQP